MPVCEATACFGVYVVAANEEEATQKLLEAAREAAPDYKNDIFIVDQEESEDLEESDFE